MAKVTITLEDADDGGVDIHADFDPALGELEEPSMAQTIAVAVNRLADFRAEDLNNEH